MTSANAPGNGRLCGEAVTFLHFVRLSGQVADFKAFYKKHRNGLFAYLIRSTGDYDLSGDILQESFTRYLEKYGGEGENPALLYKIARNAVIDGYRKSGRYSPLVEERAASGRNPEALMVARDDCRRVLAAMQELAREERDILSLVAGSGLPYRDIARIAGISEANVKVRVHRARVKLRQLLSEGDR